MENEFIPYEQALALKELGFDEYCFGIWAAGQLVIGNDISEYPKNVESLAPLYQQAFRFFREKYDLGHMINGIGYESFIMNIAGVLHIFNAFDFKTYEEAELACLNKLIQTVKNGK